MGTDAYSTPTRLKEDQGQLPEVGSKASGTWCIRGTLRFKQRRAGWQRQRSRVAAVASRTGREWLADRIMKSATRRGRLADQREPLRKLSRRSAIAVSESNGH